MIELPEIVTIARQMHEALAGRRIVSALQGQTAHKFCFVNHTPEEYAELLRGRTIERVTAESKHTLSWLDNGLVLMIGDMGGRILLHPEAGQLPKKHHFLMELDDGRSLSMAIQGWGAVYVVPAEDVEKQYGLQGLSPLAEAFTAEAVERLLEVQAGTSGTAKSFLTHRSPINGVGNGYCQDILFRAGLHPRHRIAGMTSAERSRFFPAIRDTLTEAIRLGGRDTERDLYGRVGGYVPILDKRAKGQPCPGCGTPIETISYLGGSCYFCPRCQT